MYSEQTRYNPWECLYSHVQYLPILNADLTFLLKEQCRHISWLGLFKEIKTCVWFFEGVFLKTLRPKSELRLLCFSGPGLLCLSAAPTWAEGAEQHRKSCLRTNLHVLGMELWGGRDDVTGTRLSHRLQESGFVVTQSLCRWVSIK